MKSSAGILVRSFQGAVLVGGLMLPALASAVPPEAAKAEHPVAVSDIVPPDPNKFLFWTPEQQQYGYRNIERIFPVHLVARSGKPSTLPTAAKDLDVAFIYKGERWDTARFIAHNRVAGLLVIKNGRIVLERYGLGADAASRWTSFSVAKSFTSTLVGAAVADGFITSIDDPVTKYLPGLKGSAYDGVTIRHLLTMTSGVRWNEDYVDPKSDVNSFGKATDTSRGSTLVTYMSKLSRAAPPGSVFHYNTGESNLLGEVVRAATGKTLAEYLSQTLWAKVGMEQDAFWITSGTGPKASEVAGCCLSIALRDYARFGLFYLQGGQLGGKKPFLPKDWVRSATTPTKASLTAGRGYGFQWWVQPDGAYEARGIFGQHIRIIPKEKLVVVSLSAWPRAQDPERAEVRNAYIAAVVEAAR